jgi:hypothetical protein
MLTLHAHSTTDTARLAPAARLAYARTADVHGERELPIWPLSVLAWIVVPGAFWGAVAVWFLAG